LDRGERPAVFRRLGPLLLGCLLISCGPDVPPSASPVCMPLPAPTVLRDEPGLLLQHWLLGDDPGLHTPALPDAPSLHAFRDAVTVRFDVEPRALLEAQLPHTSESDARNVLLALEGQAGSIREMSCLEGLLLAAQTDRAVAQGTTMFETPTEFLAYILRRGDTLKVWYYTVDQAGVGGLSNLHDPLARDREEGWTVMGNLHNHNFFPGGDALLGGVVPSATDIQAMRGMTGSLGLPGASITNGFHTIDLSAEDFWRFEAP